MQTRWHMKRLGSLGIIVSIREGILSNSVFKMSKISVSA